MAEGEVATLKKALYNQSLIMERLYNELDEEREASATAASEALSMILRLQGDKAAVKMEACQYKRMAEEKMNHAEESLVILEEIMYQKEMEIASLNFQVKAYKHKLLRIGVDNPDIEEMRILENSSQNGSNAFLEKTSFHGNVRRNVSLPAIRFDHLCSQMDIFDEEGPFLSKGKSILRKIGDNRNRLSENCEESKMPDLSKEYVIEDSNYDWQQAEEIKGSVMDLSMTNNVEEIVKSESNLTNSELQMVRTIDPVSLGDGSPSCSWYSAESGDTLYNSTIGISGISLNVEGISRAPSQAEDPEKISEFEVRSSSCLATQSIENTTHPLTVHDIFEVPESYNDYILNDTHKQMLQESISEANSRLGMPDSVPQEADYFIRDNDCLKKALTYAHHGNELCTSGKGASVNYHLTLVDPKFGIASFQTDVEQLKHRLQQLEDDWIMKQEDSERCKEQLKLLKEIHEQLSTIQSHIKDSKPKRCIPQEESSVVSFMEAMLSFSL